MYSLYGEIPPCLIPYAWQCKNPVKWSTEHIDCTAVKAEIMNNWLCWARWTAHIHTNVFYVMSWNADRRRIGSIIVSQIIFLETLAGPFTGTAHYQACSDKM